MKLALKPDFEDAARRWHAYFQGEIIDRPLVCVTAPLNDVEPVHGCGYRQVMYDDPEAVVDRCLAAAGTTFYGGEAMPATWFSLGPDEVAFFCGAEVMWADESGDTNWSAPYIDDWEDALPFSVSGNALWQRVLTMYRLAKERYRGKMLLSSIDLHTNMDLLSAARGPERLCMDLIDCPAMIDRAMESSRALFPVMWEEMVDAAGMATDGYWGAAYAADGAAILQCDFSYMISPDMFNRWVMPALEEEAALVKNALYHWDGPGARVHADALLGSNGLHTMCYVRGHDEGPIRNLLPFYQSIQAAGKSVEVAGTPDAIKELHPELVPEQTLYRAWASSRAEAEDLLKWFVDNT